VCGGMESLWRSAVFFVAVVLGDSVLQCRGGSGEVLTHLPVVCMWCACGVHVVCVWCACGVHVW